MRQYLYWHSTRFFKSNHGNWPKIICSFVNENKNKNCSNIQNQELKLFLIKKKELKFFMIYKAHSIIKDMIFPLVATATYAGSWNQVKFPLKLHSTRNLKLDILIIWQYNIHFHCIVEEEELRVKSWDKGNETKIKFRWKHQ